MCAQPVLFCVALLFFLSVCGFRYGCCSEFIVARDAVRRWPREVYQELEARINLNPNAPWGWVMERVWQNLFLHGPEEKVAVRADRGKRSVGAPCRQSAGG